VGQTFLSSSNIAIERRKAFLQAGLGSSKPQLQGGSHASSKGYHFQSPMATGHGCVDRHYLSVD
jgi:hypothetical protein